METEIVKLSKVKANKANPRQIKDGRFYKLVNSILVFPKMLHLRPIVVDVAKNGFIALGGNMRSLALAHISEMTMDELRERLGSLRDFQKKSNEEQNKLFEYWQKWKVEPTAPIIRASDLSEDEKREFIIKDNVGFGEWDNDIIANEWDIDELDDWGLELIAPFVGNVDEFFEEEDEKEKAPKTFICQHCGKESII